jgi:hypothetical protein
VSVEETRRVVEGYLGGHGTEWLAELVEFSDPAEPAPHRGRSQVAEWLGRFYGGAFTEARAEPRSLVVDDDRAAYEFVFSGVHSGSLHGEAPTGRGVSVPMVVVYDVAGGEIVSARLYYDAGRLRQELAGEPAHHVSHERAEQHAPTTHNLTRASTAPPVPPAPARRVADSPVPPALVREDP